MARPSLLDDKKLRTYREAVRFGGVSFWSAAKAAGYTQSAGLWNAVRRYEKERGLKPDQREVDPKSPTEQSSAAAETEPANLR